MDNVDELRKQHQANWLKRIAFALPFVAAVMGWQYWSNSNQSKKNHADMVAMCAQDSSCLDAVEKYADRCFDENYRMGSRKQGVKTAEFVTCVNRRAGAELFVAGKAN